MARPKGFEPLTPKIRSLTGWKPGAKKGPGYRRRGPFFAVPDESVVHSTHAAHATTARHRRSALLLGSSDCAKARPIARASLLAWPMKRPARAAKSSLDIRSAREPSAPKRMP